MKYLKEYYNYNNEIYEICLEYGIKNWSIRNGLVDVDGYVYLGHKNLSKLPLKFGRVGRHFWCDCNQLNTLEGAPNWVGGNFYCYENKLTTLEGAPNWVGGNFYCYSNQLSTLEHFPNVKGKIYINDNPLPKEIYDNEKHLKQITKLQEDYDIWRDGKIYLPRFNQLIKDIENDL